jgi:hypothetical protein
VRREERKIDFRRLNARVAEMLAERVNTHTASQRLNREQVAKIVKPESHCRLSVSPCASER